MRTWWHTPPRWLAARVQSPSGDLSQLGGPAPEVSLGGIDVEGKPDGSVPLGSLDRHIWIYQSPYYRDLLEKAKFTDPTPRTTTGEEFEFQYACTKRALLPCKLMEHYLIPNLAERTSDQLIINLTSFPELGFSGAAISDWIKGMGA